jgi:hypothetical protein
MKKSLLLFAALGMLTASVSAASHPAETIRGFYRWYVNELIADRQPIKDRAVMSRYISQRLWREIAENEKKPMGLDYDPFVSAQDFDYLWAKNVVVSNVRTEQGKATAEVLLKGRTKDMQRRLVLTLVNERGNWKIDRVEARD